MCILLTVLLDTSSFYVRKLKELPCSFLREPFEVKLSKSFLRVPSAESVSRRRRREESGVGSRESSGGGVVESSRRVRRAHAWSEWNVCGLRSAVCAL